MSPVFLRRFRAERLLHSEFESLRKRVLGAVAVRLRAGAIELDRGDIEAAYAVAWQGLYASILEGREIENPSAWLVLATYRRAIDEHRAQRRAGSAAGADVLPSEEIDLAEALDARIRLGQLLEGLSGRLSERERQAATLCYLQGLSRADAAAQMGISEGRMRKLMEGRGAGDPGVSGKLGELTRTIERGDWCESQGSLMRALAYGILARDGRRYRLALSHHRSCPSCRAYVLSLRGLAGALPPTLLPGLRSALAGISGGAGGLHGIAGQLARRAHAGAGTSRGAAGAAGASGAGGGLALTSPLGAKLAVGCLMALGLGAGCIGIETTHDRKPNSRIGRSVIRPHARSVVVRIAERAVPSPGAPVRLALPTPRPSTAPVAGASREFGPEQALGGGVSGSTSAVSTAAAAPARSASRVSAEPTASMASAGEGSVTAAARREFAP